MSAWQWWRYRQAGAIARSNSDYIGWWGRIRKDPLRLMLTVRVIMGRAVPAASVHLYYDPVDGKAEPMRAIL